MEATSSDLEQNGADIKATAVAQATGGWVDFTTQITQDDKIMAVKARAELARMGGETFRPEFRETYKDQNEKKETTVHSKFGSSTGVESAAESHDKITVEEAQKEARDGAAAIAATYDSDSSDGGITLSHSDLEGDAWVAIKMGDEGRGWRRD